MGKYTRLTPKEFEVEQARRLHRFLQGDPWTQKECHAYLRSLRVDERRDLWEDIFREQREETRNVNQAAAQELVAALDEEITSEELEALLAKG